MSFVLIFSFKKSNQPRKSKTGVRVRLLNLIRVLDLAIGHNIDFLPEENDPAKHSLSIIVHS